VQEKASTFLLPQMSLHKILKKIRKRNEKSREEQDSSSSYDDVVEGLVDVEGEIAMKNKMKTCLYNIARV
jgi:hypothetical protein